MSGAEHDFFLIYAEDDESAAADLFERLRTKHTVYFHAVSLLPGEPWDTAKAEALRASRVSVVIIGPSATRQYYQREEIAAAIALTSRVDRPHTVVPVHLVKPRAPEDVPFGLLRIKPIVFDGDRGMDGVSELLEQLLGHLRGRPREEHEGLEESIKKAQRRLDSLRRQGAQRAEIEAVRAELRELKQQRRTGARIRPGDVFQRRYEMEERIGEGGFATVWRAYDIDMRRTVAVKVLHSRWAESEERRERFWRGARVMASLDHPNVVKVLQPRGEHQGFHFFVMEYIEDGDLSRLVLEKRIMARDVYQIILDVALALDHAHREGIVHRDLKPANVLLDAAGHAKLTDFDLAQVADTDAGTRTGAMGTFLYAAPEAMINAHTAGPSADIFSLGMTAAFILHGADPPPAIHASLDRFTERLACEWSLLHILRRTLVLNPRHRIQSATELIDLLRWWREGILDRTEIDMLHAAAVDSFNFFRSGWRNALLAGLPPDVRASLPSRDSPSARLLSDLQSLNRMVLFVEDHAWSSPLGTWLQNAAALTDVQRAGTFIRTQDSLKQRIAVRRDAWGVVTQRSNQEQTHSTLLAADDVDTIVRAGINIDLFDEEHRVALLSALPRLVVLSLPGAEEPRRQIRSDVEWLNSQPLGKHGQAPIVLWLERAAFLARGRPEVAEFQRLSAQSSAIVRAVRLGSSSEEHREGATDRLKDDEPLLDNEQIHWVADKVLEFPIDEWSEAVLWKGIPPGFAASLPTISFTRGRVVTTLSELSAVTWQQWSRGGDLPLVKWLRNVSRLVDEPAAQRALQELAESIRMRHPGPAPDPPPAPYTTTSRTIGIDFGTTKCVAAVMMGALPQVIINQEGAQMTPSVVAWKDDGGMVVGKHAKHQAALNPKNTVSSVTRFIGRRYDAVNSYLNRVAYKVKNWGGREEVVFEVRGKEITPQEVCARLMIKLKGAAETYLGERVTDAVVTVPAYFNSQQRRAVIDAGTIAGLNIKRVVSSSTAAGVAYGLERKSDEIILVYDFGGGTLDVSVLEIGDNVVQVMSTNGDLNLGGDDIDQVITEWLIDEFRDETGVDVSNDEVTLLRLVDAAERAKIELSYVQEVNIDVSFVSVDEAGPRHLKKALTRSKLEHMIRPLVQRTMEPVQKALKDARKSPQQIDEVLLVGGSSRLPLVQETLKLFFGKEPHKGMNPAECVAAGVAIQAGYFDGIVDDYVTLDATPLSIGVETLGGVTTVMIPRGSTTPTQRKEIFSTAADNQSSIEVHVLEGERTEARYNCTLGRFTIDGIPPAPRGTSQIELTFDLDANGVLTVHARDRATGEGKKVMVSDTLGLTESELLRMAGEAAAERV